jgi:flagellar basal body rod protein FlgC
MNPEFMRQLEMAEIEAVRFLRKVKALRTAIKERKEEVDTYGYDPLTVERGAVLRSSMDVTREMAALRKAPRSIR